MAARKRLGRDRRGWWAAAALMAMTAVLCLAPPHSAAVTRMEPEPTRVEKLRLIDNLQNAPRVLIFGSSRAMRFNPGELRRRYGISGGMNMSVSSGSIADAWAFLNVVRERWPGAAPRVLWVLDMEQFRRPDLHPAVTSVPRTMPYIQAVLDEISPSPSATYPVASQTTRSYGDVSVFDANGFLRWSHYDWRAAHGWPLSRGLQLSATHYRTIYPKGFIGLRALPKRFLLKTLDLMKGYGAAPVIVLSPYHPKLLSLISQRGWVRRHQQVVTYLRSLQSRYGFALLDLSRISSFGGRASEFYDGTHGRAVLANRMLRVVAGKAKSLLQ